MTQQECPTVSAVIPAYNRAWSLPAAIDSVLAQTRPADEILLVDDGSTDNTESVIARYPQVRYIRQENRGAAAARNRGIAAARSEWISFLDSDDVWRPNKIEDQLQAASLHPEAMLVYGPCIVSYRNGAVRLNSPPSPDRLRRQARFGNPFPPSAVMVRKTALVLLGGFREDLRASCEDWELFFRIVQRFPAAMTEAPVAEYHETSSSISLRPEVMLPATLSILDTLLQGLSGPERFLYARRIRSRMFYRAAIGARAGGRHDLPLLARSLAEWPLGETVRYKALLLEFARTFGMALPRSGDPA